MSNTTPRLTMPGLSEFYAKLLKLDCYISGGTRGIHLHHLVCSKLQEREERIFKRLDFLAEDHGISREELIKRILSEKDSED
jgi:hypothetical protein